MLTPADEIPPRPTRDVAAHKGHCGTVVVIAGSDGMLGAAILAARGALRGGAGLVRCLLPDALRVPFTVACPAATTISRDGPVEPWFDGATAVVCGPGLGTDLDARRAVHAAVASGLPTVLDADALNLLARGDLLAPELALAGEFVLTPHPGEAGRLLACPSAAVQADRPAAVEALARRYPGAVAVLKGAGTLVADGSTDRLFTNQTGNAGLATGGSGDVLAGLIGALLAQGMKPFDAARLAVHVHGLAGDLVADRLSPMGLCAEDLPLAIAEVFGRPDLQRANAERTS